jgi:hypothetical protein
MLLELKMVDKADFPIFIEPIFRSMGGKNHVVHAIYPNNLTEGGQHNAMEQFLILQEKDKALQWIKLVDTDAGTNAIIGVAQWYIIHSERPAERDLESPPGTWASIEEKEYSQAVFRIYMEPRRQVIHENSLQIMCESTSVRFLRGLISHSSMLESHGCVSRTPTPWYRQHVDFMGSTTGG